MTHRPRFKPITAAAAALLALGAVTAVAVAPRSAADIPQVETVIEAVDLPLASPESIDRFMQAERVRRDDTLASLLARIGALDPAFQRFVDSDPVARKILALVPGRTVLAELDAAGLIHRFSYRLDGIADSDAGMVRPGRRVLIQRKGARLTARVEQAPVERDTEVRSARIDTTVFAAAEVAGIPDSVIAQLDDIFGPEFDVQRDIRRGDRLRVAWESVREAGTFDTPAAGRVLAVEIVSGNSVREAYWFERSPRAKAGRGEYFTPEGRSLRRNYLRSPLESSRVMSGFSNARLHPVMGDWRAHKGVDLAAPLGTRVRTVGDGVVESIQFQRGYGNVIVIRHSPGITTLYAHLNEFAEGLRKGDRVSQGDVIGYVGQTGWATGPHLHFEFMIRGQHADPMTVALQQGNVPLDAGEKRRLAELTQSRRAELARGDVTTLARFQ